VSPGRSALALRKGSPEPVRLAQREYSPGPPAGFKFSSSVGFKLKAEPKARVRSQSAQANLVEETAMAKAGLLLGAAHGSPLVPVPSSGPNNKRNLTTSVEARSAKTDHRANARECHYPH
jgi:hypothetical protein